jgi:RNA polymerase sigma-70 factor, ECF subfamily
VTGERRVQAFETVVLPHLDAAYNLARWLLRDPQDAADAVQEAALRALRFFAGFHGTDARVWLLAIVRNVCFDALRRRARADNEESFDEDLHGAVETCAQGEGDPAGALMNAADAALVNRAMESLAAVHREVLVLRELEELSYKEIAHITAVPIGTVMSRLAHARRRLRDAYLRLDREG